MAMEDDFDHMVVVNADGDHALWPAMRPVPKGWTQVGPTGPKEDCLAYIEAHWTDMTPKGARGAQARS